MGAITDIVRQNVPASYRALISVTNSYYDLNTLQGIADNVQFRLYATVAGVTQESSVFDRKEIELLGTLTSLQFIPAAIEYWGDALQSQNTSGTNEDVTYFDRRPDLWKIWEKLAARAAELGEELDVALVKLRAIVPRVSYGDNGRGILVTPDPETFPLQGADWIRSDLPISWTNVQPE